MDIREIVRQEAHGVEVITPDITEFVPGDIVRFNTMKNVYAQHDIAELSYITQDGDCCLILASSRNRWLLCLFGCGAVGWVVNTKDCAMKVCR